ncbi:unnamed protein product, partial [Adineta steineri]
SSLADIDEAEEQYSMALRKLITQELYLGMHTLTIDKLLDQYEKDVEQVKFEFVDERKKIIQDQDTSVTELQNIIYNMEKTFLDTETTAEQNFQANMEELRDRYREDIQQYQLDVENRLTALQNETRSIP